MNKRKKLILLLMIIVSTTWFLLYNLKSFNVYGTNFPCVGLTNYTLGEFYDKYYEDLDKDFYQEDNIYKRWSISGMKSGNISSMEGLTEIPYFQEIKAIFLSGTCIKDIGDTSKMENLDVLSLNDTKIRNLDGFANMSNLMGLYLSDTKIRKLEGLENMENLAVLDLSGTKISTIENVENIRSNSSFELVIWVGSLYDVKGVKNITQESYEYAINPENNIRIRVFNKNCKVTITGQDFGDSKEEIEACINIV
ncbi:hypothetical protein RZE82_06495 [Mollicutes bacterium LVI A0039]|nr:hypothetical protein RZE82_06495 [Mollicutes bacterium LVI A0039]